ncbi:MAG: GNAT family N-acetyltransferase [Candidatus Eisenbacteria bacterium]|nr:GNAT family N-acetyltransferase [Candidatus Eisenbacteria bacterium]
MSPVVVRDMKPEDEYFVSTCTHENESDEMDACGRRRLAWLRAKESEGLRIKVALLDEERVGFLYAMPIELSPWGPLGSDLMVFPCLFVKTDSQRRGAGRGLVEAAEDEARRRALKGVATMGYYWDDFWFMPATFFKGLGYEEVERRGDYSLLWKRLSPDAIPPRMIKRSWRYEPVTGRVAVDLFWHSFCSTCNKEAARVREVAAEFGDVVALREYCADDREVFLRHQTPRAIFVNGKEIGWGYEAPREGIRDAIRAAMENA